MKKILFFSLFVLFYWACKKEPMAIIKLDPPKVDTTPVVVKPKIKIDSIPIWKGGGTVAIDLDGDKINDIIVHSEWSRSGMCSVYGSFKDSIWTLNKDVKILHQFKIFVYSEDTTAIPQSTTLQITGGINNGGKNVKWQVQKDLVFKMDSIQLYQPLPSGIFSSGSYLINYLYYSYTGCPPYLFGNDGKFYKVNVNIEYANGNGNWIIFEKNNHQYAIRLERAVPYTIIKSNFKIK